MSGLSYGEILFYGGILLTAVGALTLIIGSIVFSVKKKHVRKELNETFGF